MKKIKQATLALVTVISISIFSCGPIGDKNSTNPQSSQGEGAVDSTKIPGFDSLHAADSSHASLPGSHFPIPSINTNDTKFSYFANHMRSI